MLHCERPTYVHTPKAIEIRSPSGGIDSAGIP